RAAVDPGKQIPREQRAQHALQTPGMPYARPIARQIGAVALAQQVVERRCFAVRPGVDGVPGDHRPLLATAGSAMGSATGTGTVRREIPSKFGATTQTADKP